MSVVFPIAVAKYLTKETGEGLLWPGIEGMNSTMVGESHDGSGRQPAMLHAHSGSRMMNAALSSFPPCYSV